MSETRERKRRIREKLINIRKKFNELNEAVGDIDYDSDFAYEYEHEIVHKFAVHLGEAYWTLDDIEIPSEEETKEEWSKCRLPQFE